MSPNQLTTPGEADSDSQQQELHNNVINNLIVELLLNTQDVIDYDECMMLLLEGKFHRFLIDYLFSRSTKYAANPDGKVIV